jgi:hypothetical protein
MVLIPMLTRWGNISPNSGNRSKGVRWTSIPRRRSFIGFVTFDTTYPINESLNSGPCGLNMELYINFRQIRFKGGDQ